MDDALHDEAPELISRPPQQEDVVGLYEKSKFLAFW
jgi:hypothetical protein